MTADHGPYNSERQAHAAAVAAIPPGPGHAILSWSQEDALLHAALADSGVETTAYEDGTIGWLANYEDCAVQVIAGWVQRAFEAGKAAALAGAETEWGLRYQSDDGGDVTMPYPEDEVRQILRESGDIPPSVRRTVVARQATPWAPVPGEEDGDA